MEKEKRFVIILSIGLSTILLCCTILSQVIYWKLLPQVQIVEGIWTKNGLILPKEALHTDLYGTSIYYIEEQEELFQTKYFVNKIYVTVIAEDSIKETVTVLGAYNQEWKYVSYTKESLENGMEVKILTVLAISHISLLHVYGHLP